MSCFTCRYWKEVPDFYSDAARKVQSDIKEKYGKAWQDHWWDGRAGQCHLNPTPIHVNASHCCSQHCHRANTDGGMAETFQRERAFEMWRHSSHEWEKRARHMQALLNKRNKRIKELASELARLKAKKG